MTNANRQLIAFSGNQNFVTIPMIYIKLTGDLNAAAVLNQIVYWTGKTKDPEGWFYKSYSDWQAEVGLSKYQISRVISGDKRSKKPAILATLGVTAKLKKAKGAPTVHYRIDLSVLQAAIDAYLVEHVEDIPIVNNVDNGKSTMLTMESEQSQQSITKNTAEEKEKETTSTPDGVQTTAETAEKKKEPVKQPITDVVKELETQFGIVSTGWQIAHIIQGSYKATKRKTSQTTVWVELTTRFAEEPATPEMVASFAKWYKQKTNGLSLKNTDTFLNHYAEWFKDHRQTVQKRNPVTVGKMQPAAPIETDQVDVEDMQALQKMIEEQRKKIKGEAA